MAIITTGHYTPARSAGLFVGNIQQIGLQSASEALFDGVGGATTTIIDDALLPDTNPGGADLDLLSTADQVSIYVVRPGDSVSVIAEMYGVSVNTIRWANDLSAKSTIREGQILVILPVSGIKHTVAKGDTLESLAKLYKGEAQDIMKYNGLEEKTLAVGSTVIIPGGVQPTPVAPSSPSPSRPSAPSNNLPVYAGYYMRPVNGGTRTQGLHPTNAVDIAAPIGTPVLASASGQVVISRVGGWNGGYGNYIIVQHPNNTQTLYAHLSQNNVVVGQSVTQGQTIALMGSTGRSTGPHVHFEIRGARNPF